MPQKMYPNKGKWYFASFCTLLKTFSSFQTMFWCVNLVTKFGSGAAPTVGLSAYLFCDCCYFLLNFSLDTTYGGPMDPAISPHSLGYSRIDLERWPSLKSRVNEFIILSIPLTFTNLTFHFYRSQRKLISTNGGIIFWRY